jgi:hypothetical protein
MVIKCSIEEQQHKKIGRTERRHAKAKVSKSNIGCLDSFKVYSTN